MNMEVVKMQEMKNEEEWEMEKYEKICEGGDG